MFLKVHKSRIKFLYKKTIKKLKMKQLKKKSNLFLKLEHRMLFKNKKSLRTRTLIKKWYLSKVDIKGSKIYFHHITIRIKPNNIFCTLINAPKKRMITNYSTGSLYIKTTKKRLKQNIIKVLFYFFKKVYRQLKKTVVVNLIAPKRLKKKILTQIKTKYLKRQNRLLLNIVSKKCFNGCRPPKKRRKKRKINRLFKT